MFVILSLACTNHAQDPIHVHAAVSIAPVLEKIIKSSSSTEPYRINSASSSLLAQQIKQGAKADLFASASLQWVQFLNQEVVHSWEGLGNQIVLIKNKQHTGICSLKDDTPLSIADWTHVPAGVYARQALIQLNVFAQKEPYMIPALHAHAALSYVANGDIPCGIVYRSDSLLSDDVEIVPSALDDIKLDIRYSLAVLSDTPRVHALLDIMRDPSSKEIYESFGFLYHGVQP